MRNVAFCCAAVVFLLTACAPTAPSHADASLDTLRSLDAELSRAVSRRDLERIVSFYAEDARLLPAAEPMITGRAGIREEWGHILAIPDFQSESTLLHAEVSAGGDMGYTTGSYVAWMLGENGERVREPGKWLTIWKRQSDGTWRIAIETYNTDIPPPDHQ